MKTQKRKTGDLGEDLAVKFLEKKGYKIIERNYWRPWGEIDIITEKNKNLHFIEVKSRVRYENTNVRYDVQKNFEEDDSPESNVTPDKQKKLRKIISTYLNEKNIPDSQDWQIDVIGVELDYSTRAAKINQLENAVFGEN